METKTDTRMIDGDDTEMIRMIDDTERDNTKMIRR